MRYRKLVRGNLYYQRSLPKELVEPAKKLGIAKMFVKPLGMTPDAPEVKQAEAIAAWDVTYKDLCDLIANASADDIEAERRTRQVDAFLQAHGLSAGVLSGNDENTASAEDDILEELFGDDLNQEHEQSKGKPLVSKEFIQETIARLRAEQVSVKRLTFREAIEGYLKHRATKTAGDRLKKEVSYCNRFLTTVGDHLLTTENAGLYLKTYRNALLEQYKGPTAARMLACPRAALQYAADHQCVDVFIPRIVTPNATNNEQRYTLTEAELVNLIRLITDPTAPYKPWVRLYYLLAIHCGAHALEVRNTEVGDLREGPNGWELDLRGSKTEYRERTIPILDSAVPFIIKHLPAEGSLLSEAGDVSDSALSHALAKPIKVINAKATPYSLRHTVRSLAVAYQIPTALQQSLLGWTDGKEGAHQLRYGLTGQAHVEQMKAKRQSLEVMLQEVTKMLKMKSL